MSAEPIERFKTPGRNANRASSRTSVWRVGASMSNRPESLMLLVAMLSTAMAKVAVLRDQTLVDPVAACLEAVLPDLVFFSATALILETLHLVWSHRWAARCVPVVAFAVLLWSVLNAIWLIGTKIQLQPGVLVMLGRSLSEFWPVVDEQMQEQPHYALALGAALGLATIGLLYRLLRPVAQLPRRYHALSAMVAMVAVLLSSVGYWNSRRGSGLSYAIETVRFSSHWAALSQITAAGLKSSDVEGSFRQLPRRGERRVIPPMSPQEPPNVVIVLLESVSYQATSLSGSGLAATPRLEALAAEGVEMVLTRAPVSQTNKAFWAILTGSMPDIQSDYAESVLVDEPFESLASMLGEVGYESAFFQMSTASFGGLPSLFANLGFDWAWFRENLKDESAHLSLFTADDFRMIEPMFEWVDARPGPFLLGMITSVAHTPYRLPEWYPYSKEKTPPERYPDTVEFTDAFVGEVVDQLDRRGLLDNTLLCVLGDHGESFRPDIRRARWVPYEEVIRVPWILRWPGHLKPGRRIEWPVSQLDVTPTLLELLGFGTAEAGFDGKSALTDSPPDRRLYFSAWFPNSPVGFVEAKRKLIYWPYTGRLFEYDLGTDPGEKAPRPVEGAEKRVLLAEIQDWERRSRLEVPTERFRERLLYEHWQTYSSGRSAESFYVP